jgi:hypothetical protein
MEWLTVSASPVQIWARHSGVVAAHDELEHARLVADPRRFCGGLAVVREASAVGSVVELVVEEWPYCQVCATKGQGLRDRPETVGWNVVLSVDGGTRLVVSFRSPELSEWGRWNVSAGERAEPADMAGSPVDIGKIVARSLREELGVVVDADTAGRASSLIGLCRVQEYHGLHAAIHVSGDLLGVSGADVLASHRDAVDAWEGVPALIPATRAALEAHAPPAGWTSWGRPCLLAVCDILAGVEPGGL